MVNFTAVHEDYQETAEDENLDDTEKNRDEYFYTDERRHFKEFSHVDGLRVEGSGTVGTRPIPDMSIRHDGVRVNVSDADWVSGEYNLRIAGTSPASVTTDATELRNFLQAVADEETLPDAWTVTFGRFGD